MEKENKIVMGIAIDGSRFVGELTDDGRVKYPVRILLYPKIPSLPPNTSIVLMPMVENQDFILKDDFVSEILNEISEDVLHTYKRMITKKSSIHIPSANDVIKLEKNKIIN